MRLRTTTRFAATLFLSATLAAQSLPDAVADLRRPERRDRALATLRRLGAPAAAALLDAVLAADRASAAEAQVLAQALADLGRGSSTLVPLLLAAFPKAASPAVRDALLHALGDGLLDCPDEQLQAVAAALSDHARAGLFYSVSAAAPTFAWYKYVRLRKRIELRERGLDVDGLQGSLRWILAGRAGIGQMFGPNPRDVHDLGSFGQHGTREQLEAIAQVALDLGPAARPIAQELAEYLAPEPPRPGVILTEHCAGIGEPAPVETPSRQLPTLWRRDDWRFAIARAVLAHDDQSEHRQQALRHLLYAPTATERLRALALVRDWPRPWTAFLPDLAACLSAPERNVVRDALVLLGQIEGAAAAAAEPLRKLAQGSDEELAARARKILAQGR